MCARASFCTYVCVCVCVCMCARGWPQLHSNFGDDGFRSTPVRRRLCVYLLIEYLMMHPQKLWIPHKSNDFSDKEAEAP